MADQGCIFCEIVAGRSPAQVVMEDARTLAFMDIAPATRGHVLVIPKRHAKDLLEIEPEELCAVAAAARRVALRLREVMAPDGVNLLNCCGASAWQSVFHFHMHVIPRYEGDPLRLPWQPATGDPGEIMAAAGELR